VDLKAGQGLMLFQEPSLRGTEATPAAAAGTESGCSGHAAPHAAPCPWAARRTSPSEAMRNQAPKMAKPLT